jgi:hypothetical protein
MLIGEEVTHQQSFARGGQARGLRDKWCSTVGGGTLPFASWNQIASWLCQLDGFARARKFGSSSARPLAFAAAQTARRAHGLLRDRIERRGDMRLLVPQQRDRIGRQHRTGGDQTSWH